MDTTLVSWAGRDTAFEIPFYEEQAARRLSARLALARQSSRPQAWSNEKQGRCLYFTSFHLRFYDGELRANLYSGQLLAPARLFQWMMQAPLGADGRKSEALRVLRPGDDALCWEGAAAVLSGAARNMAARDRFFTAVCGLMRGAVGEADRLEEAGGRPE